MVFVWLQNVSARSVDVTNKTSLQKDNYVYRRIEGYTIDIWVI